ncbi:MAG: hypothetical protein ACTSW4_06165, partial [Candidatus Ranarchaeia archaeon]
ENLLEEIAKRNVSRYISEFFGSLAIIESGQSELSKVRRHALRSAVAAIMARNMSHIQGSHMEHGFRNSLDEFENLVRCRLASDSSPFVKGVKDRLLR